MCRSHLFATVSLLLAVISSTVKGQEEPANERLDLYGAPLPPGALARMESARLRSRDQAQTFALALSPGGTFLASDTYGGRIRLWSPVTGEELPQFRPPIKGDRAIAFSPDGKLLATGSRDSGIHLYEFATGKELATLPGHKSNVQRLIFSKDSKRLISHDYGREPKLVLWDVEARQVLKSVPQKEFLGAMAVTPDGSTLALGSHDGSIHLWDAKTLKEKARLPGHKQRCAALVFTPDGKVLISGGSDETIRFWDTKTGKPQGMLKVGYGVQCLAIRGDGLRLASGGQYDHVELWNLETGKLVGRTPMNSASPVWAVTLTPDGKHMAWADQYQRPGFAEIVNDEVRTLRDTNLRLSAVGFTTDDKSVITVGDDRVRFWNASTGRLQRWMEARGYEVRSFVISTDGKTLLLGCTDGAVRIRDSNGGTDRFTLAGKDGAVTSIAVSRDGKILAAAAGTRIRVADAVGGKELRDWTGHDRTITALALNADGDVIASASEDGTVRLWNTTTGKELRRFKEHGCPVTCVAFSPDGKEIASGSWDGAVRLWDVSNAKETRLLEGHEDNISAVAFSPDGAVLASSSWDGTARLWAKTGRKITSLRGHQDEIDAVAFGRDGKRLVTISRDQTALVWDISMHR